MIQTRKKGFRIAVTLLLMVVLMLGMTVTAYAMGDATIYAEGGKFTARQDGSSGSWKVDQIKVHSRNASTSLPDTGDYTFLYSDGAWYTGNGLENTIVPARTGYTFGGHFTSKNGGGTMYYNAAGQAVHTIVSDKTLYAYWTPNTYAIYFRNDNQYITAYTISATYDQSYTLPAGPTKTGYIFAGWKIGNTIYKAGASVKNLSAVNYGEVYTDAQWTPATYTVTFDRQNGTGGSASATATYAANMPNITAPTYSGFTFLGYFDAPTGGTKYYNANGTSAKAWDKTANTTLYAQWQTNSSINVNTQALIIDAFKWAPTNNTAVNVTMSGNIDVYNTTNPAGIISYNGHNITLNLNGYTLRQTHTSHSCVVRMEGGTLHIKDSSAKQTGTITNKSTTASCSAIWVNNANAKFYLDSGTITGCRTDYWGGGVCVDVGQFYMTGGTISNCTATKAANDRGYGGGVCIKTAGSKFEMSGGTITGCTAGQWAGGVYCQPSCTFTMTGGTISNCTAGTTGGGINLDGPFTISGGVIENCTAATRGGGLYVHSSCAGGTITGNFIIQNCTVGTPNSSGEGGGVYNLGTLTMSGGVVQGCSAGYNGGGVANGGTFTLSGGVIWKNRVTFTGTGNGKGGGIWAANTTTMTGGYIVNNTVDRNAAYAGVGIYGTKTFNMQGGIICGNRFGGDNGTIGGGVGMDNGSYYNKTGGLVDPAIDLTLEDPLAPVVHITMKDNITLAYVTNADATAVTNGDTMDFVGTQFPGGHTVTWDLNGHTLDLNNMHYILVDAGATFTLKDSGEDGNIINGNAGYYYAGNGYGYSVGWRNWGGAVYVRGGTFNMESGIIENCEIRHYGGGVAVWSGTFNMSGGIIRNCKINNSNGCGGGVCINTNAVFNMSGNALIENCSSATYGGGLLLNGNSTFTMKDNATIKDCTAASYGGGVCDDGTFTMTGGTITGCTAGSHSGGVFVNNNRIFTMTGGTISNCTAGTTGGGVDTNGTFTMTNGVIENCVSNGGDLGNGGGVFVWSSGSFTMTDSIIRNCKAGGTAANLGKGGAVHSHGPFTMKGNSLIYGNTSLRPTMEAPGVSLTNGGTFNLQSGIVYGNWNTADNVRAGLYTEGTGTLNQTGGYIDPKTVITLDPNGGTAGTETVTVYYGDTAMPKIEKLPTRAGYSFGGFFDAAEGGTQYYDAEGNNIALSEEKIWDKLDETMTLYARWTPNNYTISYDANGGEGAPEAMTAAYNAEVTLSSTVPTKTGYTFKEWNTEKDGSGTAYAKGATVKNLASGGETVTLYAQWTANTYTVTLNNGESAETGTVTATYNAVLPDVTVPTWKNHVFEGYYTEENGKGEKYIDNTGKGVKTWDKTADTTLYAFWKESAKIESMDLLLGGDIGMRYHVAVNDPELRETGTMTVSIGSKKPSTTTKSYSEAPKDDTGAILFPFTVSSIQMAEPVKVEFKDKDGKVIASDAKSVEDYYKLVKDSSATDAQKEMVRTLVNYGYHAQQALSKTNGWTLGTDYAASSQHGSLSSTANDLKAYKPVISGSDPNVKDIQLSLLLDNKTTLCVYVLTADGKAPAITVDGAAVSPEDNGDGWWLVRIPDIDALNLSTMHTVTANGYTVHLSALSYASVAGKNTIDAMRALLDYYHATLTANGKKMLTSAAVAQSEYDYTGQKIEPVLTVMAGNEEVTGYHVEWNGDLINAGTYTGLVTKEGYVGGVTVKVTIKPVKVEAPIVRTTEFTYNGKEHSVLMVPLLEPLYTLENNSATDAGEYTAIAALKDEKNTCWTDGTTEPKTYDWRIDPMEVRVPQVEKTEFTYDGTQKTVLTVEGVNPYTVTGNKATEAGEYTATVALKDKKNNCWTGGTTEDISIKWSIVIVKTKVEKPTANVTSFAYDGTQKTVRIVPEDARYTLSDNTGTNAGSYTAIVTLKDTVHTCWSDGSTDPIQISWTITKKEVTVPTAVTGLVYNGSEQTGVNEGDGYTLSGTTKATNAGDYTATAALTDPTNTCWKDEGKTTEAKTIGWSIAKADPKVASTVTVTYHPNGGSAEFSGSMNVNGTFSYDPDSEKTTFTPEDTQNYNTVTVDADVTVDNTATTFTVPLDGNKEETE